MKKLLLIGLLFSGCAVVQEINMNGETAETGELIVQFSDNIKNVRATLDDQLVRTNKKLTKEMIIYNIQPGEYELKVTAASWELRDDLDYHEIVDIRPGQQSAVIIPVPPKSGEYWALQIATFAICTSIAVNAGY